MYYYFYVFVSVFLFNPIIYNLYIFLSIFIIQFISLYYLFLINIFQIAKIIILTLKVSTMIILFWILVINKNFAKTSFFIYHYLILPGNYCIYFIILLTTDLPSYINLLHLNSLRIIISILFRYL